MLWVKGDCQRGPPPVRGRVADDQLCEQRAHSPVWKCHPRDFQPTLCYRTHLEGERIAARTRTEARLRHASAIAPDLALLRFAAALARARRHCGGATAGTKAADRHGVIDLTIVGHHHGATTTCAATTTYVAMMTGAGTTGVDS